MNKYKLISSDNSSYIEVEKIEYNIEDDYHPSVSFDLHFKTPTISYQGSGYWYDRSDLEDSISIVFKLEKGETSILQFNAYSELKISIEKLDNSGHFLVKFKLDDSDGSAFKSQFIIDMAELEKFGDFLKNTVKGF